jgi:hypothetical protein
MVRVSADGIRGSTEMAQVRQVLVGSGDRLLLAIQQHPTPRLRIGHNDSLHSNHVFSPHEVSRQTALAQFRYAQLRQRSLIFTLWNGLQITILYRGAFHRRTRRRMPFQD